MGACLTCSGSGQSPSRAALAKSEGDSEGTGQKKVYSWDKRRQAGDVDPDRYRVSGREGATVVKMPGDIDGHAFVIRDCKNCNVLVFDRCSAVTIDDCTNCRIFVGPTAGSVFIRDCSDLDCGFICQQFRTRDCHRMRVLLCCVTQPIIEASRAIEFGCLQVSYRPLYAQLEKCKFSVYNNSWSTVHDFTADTDCDVHWSLLPSPTRLQSVLSGDMFAELDPSLMMNFDVKASVIPLTYGEDARGADEPSALVIFFQAELPRVKGVMSAFWQDIMQDEELIVIQSKQVKMSKEDCARVFGRWQEDYTKLVEKEPVVGVEVQGTDCCERSRIILENLVADTREMMAIWYVSPDEEMGKRDVDEFYHFISMVMSA